MNPYTPGQDIFRTSADTRFNSFTGPGSMAYSQANNGNWGVDPNLLTPSYTAAYRPAYNGNQGDPNSPRPGFGQSLNQAFNPFAGGGNNYGGNWYQQNSPYFDTLGYNPLDHGANLTQKWIVPGFASWMSYRFLAKPLGGLGERLAGGIATGIAGGTFSAGTTATIGAAAGNLGRIGMAMYGPMAVAQTISWIADKAVFDPYIAQRQTANDLRRDFAGVTFGDGSGNSITGKGFSRYAAAKQARQISVMGAEDMTFNQSEVSNLTDLSARSGLLDTAQGGQIADRMRLITKQVKMVMQIANTSDFKEAIEILSKLQTSGVGTKDVTSVMSRLGGMASVAGVSLQKMMSTVGAQGEYLFGSNGLTPYVGQLTAATAYGGFSAAYRSGLISPGLMARMGGVEGATQSATAGVLAMAESPFARMDAFNKYLKGGSASSVVGTTSKFGGAMAEDILNNMGRFEMNSAALASKSLEEEGLRGQMAKLRQLASITPGAMTDDGKSIKYGAAYELLTKRIGLTDQNAQAVIHQQFISQDPKSRETAIKGLDSAYKEAQVKSIFNEQYGYGFATPLVRPIIQGANTFIAGAAGIVGDTITNFSRAGDAVEKWRLQTGIGGHLDSLIPKEDQQVNTEFKNTELIAGYNEDIIKISKEPEIIEALKTKIQDRQNKVEIAIAILVQKGILSDKYDNKEFKKGLAIRLMGQGLTASIENKQITTNEMTGFSGAGSEDLIALGLKVANEGKDIMTEEDMVRYYKDKGIKGGDLSDMSGARSYLAKMFAKGVDSSQYRISTTGSKNLKVMAGLYETKVSGINAKKGYEDAANETPVEKTQFDKDQAEMDGVKTINVNGTVTIVSNSPITDKSTLGKFAEHLGIRSNADSGQN